MCFPLKGLKALIIGNQLLLVLCQMSESKKYGNCLKARNFGPSVWRPCITKKPDSLKATLICCEYRETKFLFSILIFAVFNTISQMTVWKIMISFRNISLVFLTVFLLQHMPHCHSVENGTSLFPCSELNSMEPPYGPTQGQKLNSEFGLLVTGHGKDQACFDPYNWTKGKFLSLSLSISVSVNQKKPRKENPF